MKNLFWLFKNNAVDLVLLGVTGTSAYLFSAADPIATMTLSIVGMGSMIYSHHRQISRKRETIRELSGLLEREEDPKILNSCVERVGIGLSLLGVCGFLVCEVKRLCSPNSDNSNMLSGTCLNNTSMMNNVYPIDSEKYQASWEETLSPIFAVVGSIATYVVRKLINSKLSGTLQRLRKSLQEKIETMELSLNSRQSDDDLVIQQLEHLQSCLTEQKQNSVGTGYNQDEKKLMFLQNENLLKKFKAGYSNIELLLNIPQNSAKPQKRL
jgi:hypothetical protein